jgi:hypothetical protein
LNTANPQELADAPLRSEGQFVVRSEYIVSATAICGERCSNMFLYHEIFRTFFKQDGSGICCAIFLGKDEFKSLFGHQDLLITHLGYSYYFWVEL